MQEKQLSQKVLRAAAFVKEQRKACRKLEREARDLEDLARHATVQAKAGFVSSLPVWVEADMLKCLKKVSAERKRIDGCEWVMSITPDFKQEYFNKAKYRLLKNLCASVGVECKEVVNSTLSVLEFRGLVEIKDGGSVFPNEDGGYPMYRPKK